MQKRKPILEYDHTPQRRPAWTPLVIGITIVIVIATIIAVIWFWLVPWIYRHIVT
jgi:hypothetical protein